MHEVAPKVRAMGPDDLELVLRWRNDSVVRAAMFSGHAIAMEEHRKWFESASADPARHLLLFQEDGVARGFVQFRLDGAGVAVWGFYAAPEAPRGTGTKLGVAALDYAFGTLGLCKVTAEVRGDNARSLRFHRALGFVEAFPTPSHDVPGRPCDVHHFELTASAWAESR